MQPTVTTLQVYHRYFKIPLNEYINSVADFSNPWDERAYQHVVHKLLAEKQDNGLIGMVRQEKDENYIYLDAAVRYLITQDSEKDL